MRPLFSLSLFLRRLLAVAVLGSLAFSASAFAAEDHQLSEKISTELQKLKPLTDAKSWDAAIAFVNGLKPMVVPDSYDVAVLTDIEAKIYIQKGDYAAAIGPMETTLRLADAYGYFDEHAVQENVYYLATIFYQEAVSTKNAAQQQQYFSKALSYIKRYLQNNKKPATDQMSQDAQLFYANVLVNEAILDPAHINHDLLKEAEAQIEKALSSTIHPKDSLYLLLLAALQQDGDYVRSAEILEILVKNYPSKKDYWENLRSIYLNLGQDKNEEKARQNNLRAIITIERAQALGLMRTPKANFELVGIYFNIGQFGKATELLYKGLKDGSIESDQKNWELLAYSYQQIDQPFKAIEALKEAARLFPHSGQLDDQAARIYYSLDKPADAYRSIRSAVAKGHLDKPGAAYNFLAYVSFELRKFDEALAAVDKALALPDSKNDPQLPRLKQAIEGERDAQKAATAK